MRGNPYYLTNRGDLPPCAGEIEKPGINWCFFCGYPSYEIAAERFKLLSLEEPVPGEIYQDKDGTYKFRLHY